MNKKVGEILIKLRYVSREDVSTALNIQRHEGGLLGFILIKQGKLTNEQLINSFAYQEELSSTEEKRKSKNGNKNRKR